MKNLTTGNDDSRATLVRVGILVAIACMVATVVWLGARTRADDSGGPDTTGGDNSSQTVENTSGEQVEIGKAHVSTPVDNAPPVFRLFLQKTNIKTTYLIIKNAYIHKTIIIDNK